MLEIFALIFLCKKNKAIAVSRGRKPHRIRLAHRRAVDRAGVYLRVDWHGGRPGLGMYLIALLFAVSCGGFVSYLITKNSKPGEGAVLDAQVLPVDSASAGSMPAGSPSAAEPAVTLSAAERIPCGQPGRTLALVAAWFAFVLCHGLFERKLLFSTICAVLFSPPPCWGRRRLYCSRKRGRIPRCSAAWQRSPAFCL
jgi:hypothetical protein